MPESTVVVRDPAAAAGGRGYVDWPAIFAGTVLAVALSVVLLTFGSAIGLSIVSFEPREGASIFWLGIVTGLWFLWVAVTSFGAGGYLAGRLRRPAAGAGVDEVEMRDGAHGLVVWALGIILGASLAAAGITGAIGAAGRVSGTVAETASQAISGDLDYIGSRLLRTSPAGAGGEDNALDGRATALITRGLTEGQLAAEDRDYLASIVASRTGQPQEQAAAQVDAAFSEAQQLYEQAIDTAERARVAAAIAGFLVAATLLASAAAAYMAAAAGGDHRDRHVALKW